MCDLDVIGTPSKFRLIRSVAVLVKMLPILDLICEENSVPILDLICEENSEFSSQIRRTDL